MSFGPQTIPHGHTLTIVPPAGRQKGTAARLLGRLVSAAHMLGIHVLDSTHLDDGRARAVVAMADAAPRRIVAPALDPLPLLTAILYRPVPAALRPASLSDAAASGFTGAAMLWRAAMTRQALPLEWAIHGLASQPGPEPLALSLCPILLARHNMLPANVTAQAAMTILPLLLGCGHGRVRVADTVLDTILVPAQLVRALLANDGNLPPHPPAIAVAA